MRQGLLSSALLALLCVFLVGCGEEEPTNMRIGTPNPRLMQYARSQMQTPYTCEVEYIAYQVLQDLCEMAWFAAKGTPPGTNDISVQATIEEGTLSPQPHCDIQIRIGNISIKTNTLLAQAWHVKTYLPLAQQVLGSLGLRATPAKGEGAADVDRWLERALDTQPAVLEEWNKELSSQWAASPRRADLHENAALLLGIFCLRECAGTFSESRHEVCRMTAHLALARALESQPSPAGELAEAMQLRALGNQLEALSHLDAVKTPSAIQARWSRIVRTRITGDYRQLDDVREGSPEELRTWMLTRSSRLSTTVTAPKLKDPTLLTNLHFLRIIRNGESSVELKHIPSYYAIESELRAFRAMYQSIHGNPLAKAGIAQAMNTVPERCVEAGGRPRVISPGAWALHFQRHLCNAMETQILFIHYGLSCKAEADEIRQDFRERFADLWFSLLIRSQPDSFEQPMLLAGAWARVRSLITQHPALIPSHRWLTLLTPMIGRDQMELQKLMPTMTRWADYLPVPGTAYPAGNPGLPYASRSEAQTPDTLKALLTLAPYSRQLCESVLKWTDSTNRPVSEVLAVWGVLTNYDNLAMWQVAHTQIGNPAIYEAQMKRLAELSPYHYFTLGEYVVKHGETNRGMDLIEKGYHEFPDRVGASHWAPSLVHYHQKGGRDGAALAIAKDAADTYSGPGLRAMADYHEFRGELRDVATWLQRLEERYDSLSYVQFCIEHSETTQDLALGRKLRTRLAKERDKRGVPASRLNRAAAPSSGVFLVGTNENTVRYGMQLSNVVVAVNGLIVTNYESYSIARIAGATTTIPFIFWNGSEYKEVTAELPDARLGVSVQDFQKPKTP